MTEELPIVLDILQLCKSLQAMRVAIISYLGLSGTNIWEMQILAGKKINDIATISDEAFVLLVLKNIWDDMIKVKIDDYYLPKKQKNQRTMRTVKVPKDRFIHCDNK